MQRSTFPYMGNPGQETFNPHYHESYRFGSNPYPMPQQAVQRKRQPFNKHQAPHRHNFGQEHWCETCDRSFNSLELLERHKQQHQVGTLKYSIDIFYSLKFSNSDVL